MAKKTIKKKVVTGSSDADVKSALKDGPLPISTLKRKVSDPLLEKRLARMRKEGKVQVVKGRWVLSDLKVCPHCGGHGWIKSKE